MGKIKSHIQDFLEEGGYDLGYSMDYLPELGDFKYVVKENIDAQEYKAKRAEIKKEVQAFKVEVEDLKKKYNDAKKRYKKHNK